MRSNVAYLSAAGEPVHGYIIGSHRSRECDAGETGSLRVTIFTTGGLVRTAQALNAETACRMTSAGTVGYPALRRFRP